MKNSHPPKTALFLPFHRFSDRSVRRSRPRIRHFSENDGLRLNARTMSPSFSDSPTPLQPWRFPCRSCGIVGVSDGTTPGYVRIFRYIMDLDPWETGGLQCCRRMLLYSQKRNQFNTMSKRILLEIQLVDGSIDSHHVVPDVAGGDPPHGRDS